MPAMRLLFALGCFSLALSSPAHAQYSRIVAGQTMGMRVTPTLLNFGCSPLGQCEELDVDGDGTADLVLSKRSVSTGGSSGVFYIRAEAIRPDTELAGADSATWAATNFRQRGTALPLALGDSISERPLSSGRYARWNQPQGTVMSTGTLFFSQVSSSGNPSTQSGYWKDTATHCLGVRMLERTGVYRYGWIRIKGQATVVSYAFQNRVLATRGELAASLQLYPNPATDQVYLQLPTPHAVRYEVLDAVGTRRLAGTLPGQAAARPVALRGLPPGVYILRIYTGEGAISRRISKV